MICCCAMAGTKACEKCSRNMLKRESDSLTYISGKELVITKVPDLKEPIVIVSPKYLY
jgi:hypothetical protein